jgi:hypothetical protein
MADLNLIKILTIIEALSLTSLLIFRMVQSWGSRGNPITGTNLLFATLIVVLLSLFNCVMNFYLANLQTENSFFTKKATVFFWVIYALSILNMILFSILTISAIVDFLASNNRLTVANISVFQLSFAFFITIPGIYIAIRQPFFYFFVRRNYCQANELSVSSIGSGL